MVVRSTLHNQSGDNSIWYAADGFRWDETRDGCPFWAKRSCAWALPSLWLQTMAHVGRIYKAFLAALLTGECLHIAQVAPDPASPGRKGLACHISISVIDFEEV